MVRQTSLRASGNGPVAWLSLPVVVAVVAVNMWTSQAVLAQPAKQEPLQTVVLADGRTFRAVSVRRSVGRVFIRTDRNEKLSFLESEMASEAQAAAVLAASATPSASNATGTGRPAAALPTRPPAAERETVYANLLSLYKLEKYDQVLRDGEKALVDNPAVASRPELELLLARTMVRLGRYSDAKTRFDQLGKRLPRKQAAEARAAAAVLERYPDGKFDGEVVSDARSLSQGDVAKKNELSEELVFVTAQRTLVVERLKTEHDKLMAQLKPQVDKLRTAAAFEAARGRPTNVRLPYARTREAMIDLYDDIDASLGGATDSYRAELVRLEAEHIAGVLALLQEKVAEVGPMGKSYPVTNVNGRQVLSGEGRALWQQRTDIAIAATRIALSAASYLKTLYEQSADFSDKAKDAESTRLLLEEQVKRFMRDRDRTTLN